jgi:hypothetical protein
VGQVPAAEHPFDVRCPHCGRDFRSEVISGQAARHTGFKCPHCRLFVPYDRAETRDAVEETGPPEAAP